MANKTIADLDVEIKGELTDAITAVKTKVTDLEASIEAGQDTTAQIAELHDLADGLLAVVNPAPANPGTGDPGTGTDPGAPSTGVAT